MLPNVLQRSAADHLPVLAAEVRELLDMESCIEAMAQVLVSNTTRRSAVIAAHGPSG